MPSKTQKVAAPKKLKLGQEAELKVSRERGIVIGRAEYTEAKPQCLLRYRAADGRAVESWWSESELVPVPAPALATTK